ncbi:hypothetical protein JCM19274_486 [Algibacter lectus]|uniref:Uncharacterized protein n=1 Tax=Algibacter lectus TaxID=221126 RepID=A0A090WXD6_9FLAO|nr:hypothetical protein [Algibacter lectus]GAL81641.1 hypothetical protein JCM19274_486 [Algibacter lectus]
MKKTVFILSFIFSTLIFAQNSESSTLFEKEYYDLMNYIPKNLNSDSIYKPDSRLLKTDFNTIGSLKGYNLLKDNFQFSDKDRKWLEERIDQIATELFNDGKRILISAVGGYSGCPDKMIDIIKLNNIDITNLKFCHSCTDSYRDENFIKVFNNKMYSLMEIQPPNIKTESFYGEFEGRDKDKFKMKLVLKDDRTFKFWLNKGHGSDFTEGLWKNKSDTLILNSRALNKTDSISFALSSARWIEFNVLEFRLKKEKLIELNNGKRKLKKTIKKNVG